mmetsp:Transcript_6896/g.9131  ORF Transcript_6896/g.9131 Transcript_6896/m.9131 type:complete len:397 (+) Transcript_6896:39-1229(+)
MRLDTRRTFKFGGIGAIQSSTLLPAANLSQQREVESSTRMSAKRSIDDGPSSDRKRPRKALTLSEHLRYKMNVELLRNSNVLRENSLTSNFKYTEQYVSSTQTHTNTVGKPISRSRLDTTLPLHSAGHPVHSGTSSMNSDVHTEAGKHCKGTPAAKDECTQESSSQDKSSDSTSPEASHVLKDVEDVPDIDVSKAPKPRANVDPDSYIRELVSSILCFTPKISPASSLPSDFFCPITDEQLSSYTNEVVEATRENKIDALRAFHSEGNALDCCNRFGESLLHMACRRGYTDMVSFLLNEAHILVRIKDDCGRTPLHDACWHRLPQYNIIDTLLRIDPYLLLIGDKRGHSPFAYARREHWAHWNQFLYDRRDVICLGIMRDMSELKRLFCKDDAKFI